MLGAAPDILGGAGCRGLLVDVLRWGTHGARTAGGRHSDTYTRRLVLVFVTVVINENRSALREISNLSSDQKIEANSQW